MAAFVDACANFASRRGRRLPPEAVDPAGWRQRFEHAYPRRQPDEPAKTRARLAHREQLEEIAPDRLLDRERELTELAAFCAGDEPYSWWQAGPWAGKTALLSWFALNLPPGVDVVSFFVTNRFAGQSDSDAVTDAMIEQLATIVGEPVKMAWPARARRGHLWRLLKSAARHCAAAGRRLLLIIDGLDEDTSKRGGADRDSIAALLPRRPPPGVRVLVASRLDPDLPDDVPGDHPMRRLTPRPLLPSRHARDLERLARTELTRALVGPPIQRDILGLLTACGGGLTQTDLEHLTKRPRYELESELGCAFGRSVTRRHRFGNNAVHNAQNSYLFAHDTLYETAVQRYGASLADYRNRLHEWARSYQGRGWPSDTPQYLLYGYPKLLADTADADRLTKLAADSDRHQQMRELTGGDALALSEIVAAAGLVTHQPKPDLCAMVRLAIHRDHLTHRNSNVPPILLAVLTRLGDVTRAESIANSITAPIKRVDALTSVATATAQAGDRDRAALLVDDAEHTADTIDDDPALRADALARVAGAAAATGDVDRAEQIAYSITDHPGLHAKALARIAGAAAKSGDFDRAEQIAHTIDHPPHRDARALAEVAGAVAEAGDIDRAEHLAHTMTNDHYWQAKALARIAGAVAKAADFDRAERISRAIADCPDGHARANALARVAGELAEAGDSERAKGLRHDAAQLARTIREPHNQANVLEWIAEALVKSGDVDGAEQAPHAITYPPYQIKARARVAAAVATTGDFDRAERIAHTITDYAPDSKAEALARIAGVVADAGDSARAARHLDDAAQVARTITVHRSPLEALARIAGAVAEAGDFNLAEQIAHKITSSHWQAAALARIAGAVAAARDFARAARIADTITRDDRYWQVEAQARVAEALAKAGEFDRAEHIAQSLDHTDSPVDILTRVAEALAEAANFDQAEHIANTNPSKTTALARVAAAVAKASDFDRATQIAYTITDLYSQAKALAWIAGAVTEAGESGLAARLLDDAEQLLDTIPRPFNRVNVQTVVAEAAATAGDRNRAARLLADAEHTAHTITHTYSRASALTRVAQALAVAGDVERAEHIAHTITLDRSHRAKALIALAQIYSSPRRERVVAEVLMLDDWQLSVDVLAEVVPATLDVILTELTTVGLA